jgi:hypothetical protein
MAEKCIRLSNDHYDILIAPEAAQLVEIVNRFLDNNPDWRLHGSTFFVNGGYRQAVRRRRRDRSYLLPHPAAPIAHR